MPVDSVLVNEFRLGDACSVPYPDVFFDVARSERLFLYLPDRLAAIKELMHVVKPGGRVCLLDTDIDCTGAYSKNPVLMRKMTSLVEECLAEQAALQACGDFFQMWTLAHVTGTV
jgi:ubiquinone/menaquinone biosynthesis C-methylase UbiE